MLEQMQEQEQALVQEQELEQEQEQVQEQVQVQVQELEPTHLCHPAGPFYLQRDRVRALAVVMFACEPFHPELPVDS
jgi:hypothetical protein